MIKLLISITLLSIFIVGCGNTEYEKNEIARKQQMLNDELNN